MQHHCNGFNGLQQCLLICAGWQADPPAELGTGRYVATTSAMPDGSGRSLDSSRSSGESSDLPHTIVRCAGQLSPIIN